MAESQISSTQIVQRPDVYIEPGTGPSIVPFRVESGNDEFGILSIENEPGELDDFTPPMGDADGSGSGLQPPDYFQVISQTARIAPDGTTVMDLIVEIGDVLGATGYELRYV
jgi:hypothetical protein